MLEGITVMMGWIFDIYIIKSVVPGSATMKFNTALGFALTGLILFTFLKYKSRVIYKSTAVILLVLAGASLFQGIFGFDLGIDEFFMIDKGVVKTAVDSPGRPSAMTLLCFSLIGMVFLAVDSKKNYLKKVALSVLNLIMIIAFVAIMGYFFGIPTFYKHSYFSSMAIHTAFSFLILSIGISALYKDMGLLSMFLSKSMGGVMMRKLFPRLIVTILFLGFIRKWIYQHQIFSIEFGTAFFTALILVITTYLLFSTAKVLNEIDAKRKEAEDEIILTNKNLEKIVKQRTQYLEKQNRQLEDFANIVSHNLRGSVGNLDALLFFYKEEETQQGKDDLFEKMEITVANIGLTLNDLLEIVRIKYDSKNERQKLSFESVFSKIKQTFEGKIMETQAEILTDFSNASEVEYLSVYLESIIQNLLSNALKYHSPNRRPIIRLETKLTNEGIVLEVSDNGLGIDLEKYGSKVFGLNKVFHDHPDAKGIGLFMTKAQIEGMGGEISVSSQVGKGTTFKVVFNTVN